MSVKAISWAKETLTGNPTSKLVLIALADYSDEHGRCWPAQATIARETELSERSVRRHLERLEGRGLLTRQKRSPLPDGRLVTDMITLSLKPADKLSYGSSRALPSASPADTVSKNQRTHSPKPADRVTGNPSLIRQPYPPRVPIQGEDLSTVVNTRGKEASPYAIARAGGDE